MKIKTSITLSKDLLESVDCLSMSDSSRSEFIETAVRRFVNHLKKERQNADDMEIINRKSFVLNSEAEDVLQYQVGVREKG